nr:hypothetical protein [Nanoarchaeum sp.]
MGIKMKVTQGKTQLTTSSGLTFVYPTYQGTHADCISQIKADGLQIPTYPQLVDIIYEAVVKDPDNQYSQEIRQIMSNFKLRSDTGLLYLPDRRIFFQDKSVLGPNGLPIMNQSELEAKLQANDSSVRFVEPGFIPGIQSYYQLVKNPYIIGLAGEQGAEQLAEIAYNHYRLVTHIFALNEISGPTTRLSVFAGDWIPGGRLVISGNDYGNDRSDRAFGVLAS